MAEKYITRYRFAQAGVKRVVVAFAEGATPQLSVSNSPNIERDSAFLKRLGNSTFFADGSKKN